MELPSFKNEEELYRAVRPYPCFIKRNGQLSTAALKDSKGLSVDRQAQRPLEECLLYMAPKFSGKVFALTYKQCNDAEAVVKSMPSNNNPFHCEIHGSQDGIELSDEQADHLASVGKFVCEDLKALLL